MGLKRLEKSKLFGRLIIKRLFCFNKYLRYKFGTSLFK